MTHRVSQWPEVVRPYWTVTWSVLVAVIGWSFAYDWRAAVRWFRDVSLWLICLPCALMYTLLICSLFVGLSVHSLTVHVTSSSAVHSCSGVVCCSVSCHLQCAIPVEQLFLLVISYCYLTGHNELRTKEKFISIPYIVLQSFVLLELCSWSPLMKFLPPDTCSPWLCHCLAKKDKFTYVFINRSARRIDCVSQRDGQTTGGRTHDPCFTLHAWSLGLFCSTGPPRLSTLTAQVSRPVAGLCSQAADALCWYRAVRCNNGTCLCVCLCVC